LTDATESDGLEIRWTRWIARATLTVDTKAR